MDSISVMEVIRFIHLNRGGIIIGKSSERAHRSIMRDAQGSRGVCEICERVVLGWVEKYLICAVEDAYGMGDWSRSRARGT